MKQEHKHKMQEFESPMLTKDGKLIQLKYLMCICGIKKPIKEFKWSDF